MPSVEIEIKDIVFSPEVQTYCNNPKFKCPNYGHSWACPPEAPYLEEKISEFKRFYVVYYQFDLKKYVAEVQLKHPHRKKDRIIRSFYAKDIVRDYLEQEIIQFLKDNNEEYEEKLIFWDGCCRVCTNSKDNGCTYDSGKACRYPDKKRYSMEAVGINVNDTVKNLKINLEWPPMNYTYRFGLICFR